MKIAIIAPINHPIAKPFKGGLETHTWWLTHILQARGHDVTLFASGDSDRSLPLFPIIPAHLFSQLPFRRADEKNIAARFYRFLRNRVSNQAYKKATGFIRDTKFDIVHNNAIAFQPLKDAGAYGAPVVTVLHTPIFREMFKGVHAAQGKSRFIAVSAFLSDLWAPYAKADIVHNGTSPEAWTYSAEADPKRAVWFGRINPTKGPHLAIDAAKRAGFDIDLYGGIDDQHYFDAEIAPRLNERARFHGSVDHDTLSRAIGQAAVMVSTPCWDEPFGLTFIESFACGTPVASFARGAAPEIITGETGVLAKPGDVEDLASAISKAATLPRAACRARFEHDFTFDRMVESYENIYRDMKK